MSLFGGGDDNGFGYGGEDDGELGDEPTAPEFEWPWWMGMEITLYDNYGEPLSYTFEQWFNLALEDKEALMDEFYMDNLDILYQLDDLGYMTPELWQEWRDQYAAAHV